MIIDYDKVKLVIITERHELKKYFLLFQLMLSKSIVMSRCNRDYAIIDTGDFHIRFYIKALNLRGVKAHYVLNLTQDKEFHNELAVPMTIINSMLDKEKWGLI